MRTLLAILFFGSLIAGAYGQTIGGTSGIGPLIGGASGMTGGGTGPCITNAQFDFTVACNAVFYMIETP